jgi:hypothetical protein
MISLNWDRIFAPKSWNKEDFNRGFAFLEEIRIALAHNHPLTEEKISNFECIIDNFLKRQ